jgi:hypothetical protein
MAHCPLDVVIGKPIPREAIEIIDDIVTSKD